MEGRTEEPGYCGLYKTVQDHHWVVLWEEFLPWFERTYGQPLPFSADNWKKRAEVLAAYFRRVVVRHLLPEVSTCEVRVGLCTIGLEHLHVILEDVVLKDEVNHE